MSKVTHLVVEQPPLHIVRDNPGLSDKYFNPGLKFNRKSLGCPKKTSLDNIQWLRKVLSQYVLMSKFELRKALMII